MKTLIGNKKSVVSIFVTILIVFSTINIVHAQDTLVTNINQPYTWYHEFGEKIDLPDWLDDDDDEATSLFELVTISAGFAAGAYIGAHGGFAGFAVGAFIGKEVGEGVAELTPEVAETVATDMNNFLGVVEDTHDRHTIPFGIWNGTLAQEFTTGSNRHGYSLSSIAIYGRFYSDSLINFPASVNIWSSSNGTPGTLLYTLPFADYVNDRSHAVRLVYQSQPFAILEPNTRYFIFLEHAEDSRVVVTPSASEDSGASPGWSIGDRLLEVSGGNWRSVPSEDPGRKVFPADKNPILRIGIQGSPLDSRTITVSLTNVGAGQFKATATAISPSDIVLPITVINGTIADGSTTVTIPAGSTESDVINVSRTPGTTFPVIVNIGNLPNPPAGYELFKTPTRLPIQVLEGLSGGITPVSERTPQVRDAIVRAAGVNSANEVTEAHLTAITWLGVNHPSGTPSSSTPIEFQTGDFSGLTALATLEMNGHAGIILPDDIFDELTSLERLSLYNSKFTTIPNAVLGLTSLKILNMGYHRITSIPAGAFDQLTQLNTLILDGAAYANTFTSLPDGVFDNLTSLTRLSLSGVELTSLPDGVFDNLTSLTRLSLSGVELTSLPDGVFDNLTSLTYLSLGNIGSLSADDFSGLSSLTSLYLSRNKLTSLPAGIFSGLSSLTSLYLSRNKLTSLPAGIFSGLSSLTSLRLGSNLVYPPPPLPLSVSLEKVGDGQFKAVAPSGAPFDIVVPVNVRNGRISGGATTLTISTGAVESASLTVTRTAGTTAAVTANIGTLPGLPTDVNQYGARLHQGYTLVKSNDLPLFVISRLVSGFIPVSERTPQVRDAIVAAVPGVNSANEVTEAHLAAITVLDLSGQSITSLKVGDFEGLTGLEELHLGSNQLTILPEDIFDGLTVLTTLRLYDNQLSSLPEDIFDELTSLTWIQLGYNRFTTLPSSIFDGLTKLTVLAMRGNQFTTLPDGIFEELTGLTRLHLEENAAYPLPLTVSLEKIGANQFKAVAPTGAPFDIVLPLNIANGTIYSGATTITIPAGELESEPLTVLRTSYSTSTVTVNIGTLPRLPADHTGYTLAKSNNLPLTFTNLGTVFTPVKDRTPQVRDQITLVVRAKFQHQGVTSVNDVAPVHLSSITRLQLFNKSITSLKSGDFSGLPSLENLNLDNNSITNLPEDVFDGLSTLTELWLQSNGLTSLPEDVLDGLSALEKLQLSSNALASLPEDVFDGLSNLTSLSLSSNALTSLPGDVFDGLSNLTTLFLSSNSLTSLPENVFDGLSNLTSLYLSNNSLTSLPGDIFDRLSNLTTLYLSRNSLTSLPEGIFEGLSNLTKISMHSNSASLLVTISLQKVGESQFKAVSPTGAPFEMVLPLTVTNGSINGGATSITIPAGHVESEILTVTRASATTNAVAVDIGTLPGLPSGHSDYRLVKSPGWPLEFTELGGTALTPVSERTPQVRDAIMANLNSVRVNDMSVDDVSLAHLKTITYLDLQIKSITSLKSSDFEGLTSLRSIGLWNNDLTTLPAGVFDGLTALTRIPLYGNDLTTLPDGIFEGLTSLTTIALQSNNLTTLPDGIFEGLTALTTIALGRNDLTTLPDGIFEGLTALTTLKLRQKTTDLSLTVSLEKVADGQFKAVAPTGAPFNIVLPLTVTNGSISRDVTSIMIPIGSVESDVLTVNRPAGSTAAVTVDIGTLPGLPTDADQRGSALHQGYELVKSADLPLEVISATARQIRVVNIPDANLRAKIADALGKASGDPITATEMATLTSLNAQSSRITNLTGLETATSLTTLKLGNNSISDISALAGLTSLTELQLWDNPFSNLSILASLTNLTKLYIWRNGISDISALAGLTSLTQLKINENSISNISILSRLTNLTELSLKDNAISDISAVAGLTNLTQLQIGNNTITNITPVQNLAKLVWLDMPNNSISDISVVQNLTSLAELYFQNNAVSDLSPLVANTGFGEFTELDVSGNPLSYPSIYTHIPALQAKDVYIGFDNRVVTAPVKISGDTQSGNTGTTLAQPFVVEVRDGSRVVFEGVPVTFAVTAGGGSLSATNTTTDTNGRAESTLTLGNTAGANTVRVSVAGITQTTTFTATATTTPIATVSPISNRTPQVRDAIVAAVPGVNAVADLTAAHLAAITSLDLRSQDITALNPTDFDGLTALTNINLYNNQLSSLPDGIFEGLTALTTIRLGRNTVDPLPISVTLEKVAEGQFKAVAPTGATFNYVLPITVTNGRIIGGATSVTIPHGSTDSATLTVTRTAGTTGAVTVDIGTLPRLPRNHYGYALAKSVDLPLEVISATAPQVRSVNIPDANLRAKIERALGKTSGATITVTEMATLTTLNAQSSRITDLTGLETATNLTTLKLGNNSISDISALTGLTSLTELQLWDNPFSNLSILASLTNLTKLYIWRNGISDISALAGLTSLTQLKINGNSISNISILSRLTNLTELSLKDNAISDISALAGLTNLTQLQIGNNTISDITPIQNLTKLVWLDMPNNSISDISVVQNLTSLAELYFQNNAVSDLSPLVANTGFGEYTELDATGNPLSYPSIWTHIPALQAKDVYIGFDNRVATTPVKISGDTQRGNTGATLTQPFVVEVRDGSRVVFEGVPVTFAVTAGGGRLSATSTTTDTNGRAESTLTLGNTAGTNTVRVSVAGITQTTTFTATATTTPVVTESPIIDRTSQVRDAIVAALPGVNSANDVTEAHLTTITRLNLRSAGISVLREDDFDGLSALQEIRLDKNQLSSLPVGVFQGLSSLSKLYLGENQLTTLPAGVFSGLTALNDLYLHNNKLTSLPADVFSGLSALTQINLHTNRLTSLPVDVFSGLSALTQLYLHNNRLASLPVNVFSGLSKLQYLYLYNNRLTNLSPGVFRGLSTPTLLWLQDNAIDPLPLTISLEKVGVNRFKATAPAGAPFTIILPVNVANGRISGGATTLTIPQGGVESTSRTVTRTSGTTGAVTVDIGTLPRLPTRHRGYEPVKSANLPLTIFNAPSNRAPVFTDGVSATRTIVENTASGVNIGTPVSATDADNDSLTYSLSGTNAAAFSIVRSSGQLQTSAALDYETKSTYTVTITVSDGTLTDTITVTINITDVVELPTDSGICAVGDILAPGESCTYPDSEAVFSVLDNGNSQWEIPNLPSWLQWINQVSIGESMRVSSTINGVDYHFKAKAVSNNSWEIEEIGDDRGTQPTTPVTPDPPGDTGIIPTLSVITAAPITEATLHGGVITLTLSDGAFGSSIFWIRNNVSVSGINGVTVESFGGERISDTQATIELEYDGNMTANGTLTVSVGAGAIEDYDGTALTSQITVPAVTESVTTSTAAPLTEATLDESVVILTLSGRKFEGRSSTIRSAVSVSGITGVTVRSYDIDRESDTQVTVELTFNGNMTSNSTLTFTVGAGAIAGYTGPALTARVSVSAGTDAPVVQTPETPGDDLPEVTPDNRTTFESSTPSGYTRVTLNKTGSVWGIPTKYTTDSNVGTVAYMVLAKLMGCNFADTEVNRRSIVYIKRDSLGSLSNFASEAVCGKTSRTWSTSWDAVRITHLRFYDANSSPNIKEAVYNSVTGQIEIPGIWQPPQDTVDTQQPETPVVPDVETPETPQQPVTPDPPVDTGGTPTLNVSTAAPLTEATLHGGIITLNLSGGTFRSSIFWIRNNVSVSGINGVTVESFGGERISDTQATIELEYDGNMTANGTLTVSVGAGAIEDYDGTALTSQITVPAVTESVTTSTAAPLTEATLDESVVILTLSGRKFEGRSSTIRSAVSVSGITGVTVRSYDIDRESDTQVTVELTFNGNMTSNGTLTFTVGAGAIAGYTGPALTARVSVSAGTDAPVVQTPETPGDDLPEVTPDNRTTFESSTPSGYTRVTLNKTGSVWGIPTKYTTDSNVGTVAYMVLAKLMGCNFADTEVNRRSIVYIKRDSLGSLSNFASEAVCGKTSRTWSTSWDAVRITHLRFYDANSSPNIKEAVYNSVTGQIEIPGIWQPPQDTVDTQQPETPVVPDVETPETPQQPVTPEHPVDTGGTPMLSVITAAPITEATLHGGFITLTLSDGAFEQSRYLIRNAVSVSGISGVTVDTSGVDRVSDIKVTVELEYEGNMTANGTLTISVGAGAIEDYDGNALTSQMSVTAVTESVTASPSTLTEATLDESIVTLTLSGRKYERWNSTIRPAVSVSGISGVTVRTFDIDRESDTEVTVELTFDGDITADDTLTFTVGADAIAGYNGPTLTSQVSVSAGTETPVVTDGQTPVTPQQPDNTGGTPTLSVTTTAPLTEATLHGQVVTLTLRGAKYSSSIWDIRDTVTVSGITGVTMPWNQPERKSDTQLTIELEYAGNIDTNGTLTFTVGAAAIVDYNGPALTARIAVSANTESVTASAASPLTEATLDESVVKLTLSGAKYSSSIFDIRDAVSVSGINGVTKPWHQPERKSDTELTVELEFDGTDFDSTSTLTFTVNADAIAGYNGPALTTQISVTAVTESVVASTPAPLKEATLDGSTVTLTLSGAKYAGSIWDIRDGVTVSGITGVTMPWNQPDRKSDTQITIELEFDGNMNTDGTLTFTVGAEAIENYNGSALTAQVPVTADRENALLANFPNPFNPETWIPYKLAKPAKVSISIYNVKGQLVRTLSLGQQSAGLYQSRSRAAHWDGKNAFGEKVASGIYFYRLTTGDFSATRKMLIRK